MVRLLTVVLVGSKDLTMGVDDGPDTACTLGSATQFLLGEQIATLAIFK